MVREADEKPNAWLFEQRTPGRVMRGGTNFHNDRLKRARVERSLASFAGQRLDAGAQPSNLFLEGADALFEAGGR